MRAFVLAAGLGTRLWPLTARTPKCLLPVGDRPLLAHCLHLLAAHGVDRVLVNTHHLHEQVAAFIAGLRLPMRVTLRYESILLGSGGTLRANREFIAEAEEFFVVYADTLTKADLTALLRAHRQMGHVATLGLFRAPIPQDCGVVTLDSEGTVVHFEEKPLQPASELAFAGVMVGSAAFVDAIPQTIPCDLGKDVFGRLAGHLGGWEIKTYVRDIGTTEGYEQAQAEVGGLEAAR